MSIRVSCHSCLKFVSHNLQQKSLKLIIYQLLRGLPRFIAAGVYGISFIRFLLPLSDLQKQVITIVPTQRQEKCIYMNSCEVLPLNSQSDVNIQYRSLLSLLI